MIKLMESERLIAQRIADEVQDAYSGHDLKIVLKPMESGWNSVHIVVQSGNKELAKKVCTEVAQKCAGVPTDGIVKTVNPILGTKM